MDDGPSSLGESVEMLRIAREDGISHIFATPHILDGLYPFTTAVIISSVGQLRSHLPQGLELHYGADVRITPDLPERVCANIVPTLGSSGYLLVELPGFVVPPNLDSLVFGLLDKGITPVITHPERHFRMMNDLHGLRRLRECGAVSQITAMSLTGGFGKTVRKVAFGMIENGLADIVASDAHNADTRPPLLSKAYDAVRMHFGEETAKKLFFENPGKILSAERKK